MALPTFARLEILRATGTPTDAYQGETWPQALWFRQRVRAGQLRRPPRRPPGGRESGDRLLVVEVDLLDPVGVEQRRCRRTISQRNCTGRASKPDRSTAHVWLCKPMTGLRQIWTRALGPLGSQEG